VRRQLVGHQDGHLEIKGGQHLASGLDDGHREALAHQVLGHLQPDEPGADHHRAGRPAADIGR
jgi:hypothetical protein